MTGRPATLPAFAATWEDFDRIWAHIQALVAAAPPFSVEQIERLRPLLAPSVPPATVTSPETERANLLMSPEQAAA